MIFGIKTIVFLYACWEMAAASLEAVRERDPDEEPIDLIDLLLYWLLSLMIAIAAVSEIDE